ncbi:uncharacterized protein LOC104666148 isoform X1 [Rhinopithecus roxellana]|uniref:uncharacterized protein LOC104666148 isoform X1 n=1 Tax=Rhinopithecus roxellana TaxID=61622 RepID=UPI0012374DC3|nr:uncharacterized protein LOC104666148 isoform X1 [Rhinopithecus roxellana]
MHVGGAVLELGCPGPPPLPPGTRRPGPPHARPRSLPPRRRPESPRARLFQVPRLDRAGVPGSPTPSFSSAAGTPHLARAIHSTCLPVSAQASCLPLLRPSWWDPIASPASTVICFTWYLQGDLSAGLQAAWLWLKRGEWNLLGPGNTPLLGRSLHYSLVSSVGNSLPVGVPPQTHGFSSSSLNFEHN